MRTTDSWWSLLGPTEDVDAAPGAGAQEKEEDATVPPITTFATTATDPVTGLRTARKRRCRRVGRYAKAAVSTAEKRATNVQIVIKKEALAEVGDALTRAVAQPLAAGQGPLRDTTAGVECQGHDPAHQSAAPSTVKNVTALSRKQAGAVESGPAAEKRVNATSLVRGVTSVMSRSRTRTRRDLAPKTLLGRFHRRRKKMPSKRRHQALARSHAPMSRREMNELQGPLVWKRAK